MAGTTDSWLSIVRVLGSGVGESCRLRSIKMRSAVGSDRGPWPETQSEASRACWISVGTLCSARAPSLPSSVRRRLSCALARADDGPFGRPSGTKER